MKILFTLLISLTLILSVKATDYIQQYTVPQKVIQFDSRYFSGIDGYFSTQNLVNQQQTEERLSNLEEQLKELTRILSEINSKLGKINGPTNDDSTDVQPDVPNSDGDSDDTNTDNNSNIPTEDGNVGGEPTELDIKSYTIFSTKCATCHGKENSEGGLRLIDKETESLFYQNLATRVNIFDRVNGVGLQERGLARMPKNGQLSDEEVETLRLWMVEGAENVD